MHRRRFYLATDRLCEVVKAHADILDGQRTNENSPRKTNPVDIYEGTRASPDHKQALKDVQNNLTSGKVKVTKLRKGNLKKLQVMKAWVEGDGTPDPALVLMKAGRNWSIWVGGKLRPACDKGINYWDHEESEFDENDDSANLMSLAWVPL